MQARWERGERDEERGASASRVRGRPVESRCWVEAREDADKAKHLFDDGLREGLAHGCGGTDGSYCHRAGRDSRRARGKTREGERASRGSGSERRRTRATVAAAREGGPGSDARGHKARLWTAGRKTASRTEGAREAVRIGPDKAFESVGGAEGRESKAEQRQRQRQRPSAERGEGEEPGGARGKATQGNAQARQRARPRWAWQAVGWGSDAFRTRGLWWEDG